nr:MAG TPA: hypothetical protein [Bacteriophage sp.]
MTSRLTLIGLVKYDDTLFNNLRFPDGVDKTIFTNTLLLDYGMLGVVYPDFYFMRDCAIPAWCDKWQESLRQVWNALHADYNPIENYDRQEHWTDSPDITRTENGNNESTMTGNENSNAYGDVSAYNASDYQAQDRTRSDSSNTSNGKNNYSSSNRETGTTTHDGRIHGNIGVTTSQQMIESELKLRKQSFYGYAVSLFMQDLLRGEW